MKNGTPLFFFRPCFRELPGSLLRILSIWAKKMLLSSRGLAGVLPPAGQIFEKRHLLENFVNFGECVVPFKEGSSRGAASGGSEF